VLQGLLYLNWQRFAVTCFPVFGFFSLGQQLLIYRSYILRRSWFVVYQLESADLIKYRSLLLFAFVWERLLLFEIKI